MGWWYSSSYDRHSSNCGHGSLKAMVSTRWSKRRSYLSWSGWVNGSYWEPWVLFSVSQLALFEVPLCYVPGRVLSTEDSNVDKREMFAIPCLLYSYYKSYCIVGKKVTSQFQHKQSERSNIRRKCRMLWKHRESTWPSLGRRGKTAVKKDPESWTGGGLKYTLESFGVVVLIYKKKLEHSGFYYGFIMVFNKSIKIAFESHSICHVLGYWNVNQ